MSVEQEKVIDIIGIDTETGRVNLTISDHLAWDEFSGEHMLALQEKINYYLACIESGEVVKKFPQYQGKPFVIKVIGKYELSKDAKKFYQRATDIIENAGFEFSFMTGKELKKITTGGKKSTNK